MGFFTDKAAGQYMMVIYMDVVPNYDKLSFEWDETKLAEYVNLSPSTKTISIRLSEHMLSRIKAEANKIDVPYQSYMKIILADKLRDLKGEYKVKSK